MTCTGPSKGYRPVAPWVTGRTSTSPSPVSMRSHVARNAAHSFAERALEVIGLTNRAGDYGPSGVFHRGGLVSTFGAAAGWSAPTGSDGASGPPDSGRGRDHRWWRGGRRRRRHPHSGRGQRPPRQPLL